MKKKLRNFIKVKLSIKGILKGIVNGGVDKNMTPYDKKIIKLVNTIAVFLIFFSILSFIGFFSISPVFIIVWHYALLIFFSYLVLLLNKKKKYLTAKILLAIFGISSAFILGIFNQSYLRVDVFLFVAYCLIIALFKNRKIILIFSFFILLLLLAATYIHEKQLAPPIVAYTPKILFYNRIVVTFILSFCFIAITWIFRESNESYEKSLIAKNEEIQSSIRYASRIQNAILPLKEDIDIILNKYFIFYKPREVVSGDFYCFFQKDKKYFCIAADCTGHGVPGAFMSVMGISLLTEIIKTKNISSPDDILQMLHQDIGSILHQERAQNSDSIDIALAVIDQENKILEYSGAKLPLLVVQNDIIQLIKGNNQSIGGKTYLKTKRFTKHTVDITQPTTIYMYSDGFQDQIGGEFKQKFRSRNLRNLLYLLHKDPFEDQKKYIEYTLKSWQEKNKQIDDILIIGLQIS